MPQLNSKHHAVVQTLLSRGPLKEEDFLSVFAGITGVNPASHKHALNDFLLSINKELAYVQFELRGCRNQYDDKVYYGVVNNVGDEQSKLGTKYSVPQIAFYKAVVEAIIQDETIQGSITNIDALNIRLENQVQVQTGQGSQENQSHIPSAFKSFSISQKDITLNELIKDQWLSNTSDGRIGLGVRSFLDLRSWFRSNDIPPCEVCNEAGVKASKCSNVDCIARMHDYCSRKKFSQRKVARICPRCSTSWPQVEGNEEEEVDAAERGQVPSNDGGVQQRTRSCKAEAVEAARANEEEEVDAAELGQVPSNDGGVRRRTRSCKAEAVEAAEANVVSPSGSMPRKRLRRCKAKNVDDGEAGPSQRTRRSVRVNVQVSTS